MLSSKLNIYKSTVVACKQQTSARKKKNSPQLKIVHCVFIKSEMQMPNEEQADVVRE